MRAIVIDEFGGPDKLHLTELPDPEPGPGEIRIAIAAAGVNPVDWKVREGWLAERMPHEFPLVPGWDASGRIDRIGDGVAGRAAGDEVYAYCRRETVSRGTYAEYVVVPARRPDNLTARHAAAVPLAALTAYQALFDAADLKADETVLVHAAAGGVGHFAVQLARAHGAHVLGTASRANHRFLTELGVDRPIDYRQVDFREAVRDILRGGGIDVVLDLVGDGTAVRSADILADHGRIVSITDPDGIAALKELGIGAKFVFVEPDGRQLTTITGLIEEGEVVPHVAEVMALSDAARAHELSRGGHVCGKIVLTVA
jgi:NADPH:quinone reductase-like Zn-dependent oxidoreductase